MALALQTNYLVAAEQALDRLRAHPPEVIAALGGRISADGFCVLPVLNAMLAVDLTTGGVLLARQNTEGVPERRVSAMWQILVLHYLSAAIPSEEQVPWVSFADLPDGRGYEQVYRARVIRRLCATAGRDRETFVTASQRIGAQHVPLGGEGFRYQVFPCLPLMIAWYEGDGELPPDASFLYPENILSLVPLEDVVVLSEGLVGRLQGKDW